MKCGGVMAMVALALALALAAAPAPAATPSTDWITLGVGTGHRADDDEGLIFQQPSFLLGVNIQRGWHVGSVRYARIGMHDAVGDLAMLYQRAVPWKRMQVSGGVGVGVLFRDRPGYYFEPLDYGTLDGGGRLVFDEGFGRAGLAWSAELVSRMDPTAGLGVSLFGNLAGERSFWGVAAVFAFGDFE